MRKTKVYPLDPEQLRALRLAANTAIDTIAVVDRPSGAINWGDLSCRQASWIVTDDGSAHAEVLIEEAAPDANDFREAVAAELYKRGWPDVQVVTAW